MQHSDYNTQVANVQNEAVIVLQWVCPAFCDAMDWSLPGSSVYGISQARILEQVAMPSSRGSSQPRDQTWISYVSAMAGGFYTTS